MKNTQFSEQINTRTALKHGARTVLAFECEIPAGDTPMAVHFRAVADALLRYAEQKLLPVAAAELEGLSYAGKGYDFTPHRICFRVCAAPVRAHVQVELSLCFAAGNGQAYCLQHARQLWCARGAYRLR